MIEKRIKNVDLWKRYMKSDEMDYVIYRENKPGVCPFRWDTNTDYSDAIKDKLLLCYGIYQNNNNEMFQNENRFCNSENGDCLLFFGKSDRAFMGLNLNTGMSFVIGKLPDYYYCKTIKPKKLNQKKMCAKNEKIWFNYKMNVICYLNQSLDLFICDLNCLNKHNYNNHSNNNNSANNIYVWKQVLSMIQDCNQFLNLPEQSHVFRICM